MSDTEEQRALRQAIRSFCKQECGTQEQRAKLTNHYEHAHNQKFYERCAELGWIGVRIPEAYGGAEGSVTDMCIVLEETGYGLAPVGGLGPTLIVAAAVERSGSEALKQEILGGIARGRVEAIAMSEPEAGSDVANLSCRAERARGGFVVNGQKTWCSNAHFADNILLICRTTPGAKHEGMTMLSVPVKSQGLEIRGIETMGGKEVNDLFFTDCWVPEARVVGQVDQAWGQLIAGLNIERLILAAMMLGIGKRAFDDTLAYVKERKQFGRPIGSFQTIKHRIADLATELELCRLLVYSVAAKVDEEPGQLFPREASMAKLKVTETAKKVALEGMQMMGGYGYACEFDMERHVRATLVSTIYGGTSEIQREIIGKTYGL
ncbi:MAG TPA: acyl-CoA dehydrogenase family protein [Polyangiaceae bacterium]|nr:acyl-CoA dehydrogenase family protein [Polyangiaceae bacterium]